MDFFQLNNKELLHRVANGDEAAFEILFHNFLPFLSNHIFRIVESKVLTEEIVQDVFLKLWLNRTNLYEVNDIKAYLIVVSKNHALNCLKKIAQERINQENLRKIISEESLQRDQIDENEISNLIDQAISLLPNRQRQIFVLHRIERMKYEEIAKTLAIGKESVKTHLKLAVTSITKYVKSRIVTFWF